MSEAPILSVVVVSWNVREDLHECLRSLWRDGEKLAMEVIVVDNASDDGTAEMVRQEFPQVRLVVNERNHFRRPVVGGVVHDDDFHRQPFAVAP